MFCPNSSQSLPLVQIGQTGKPWSAWEYLFSQGGGRQKSCALTTSDHVAPLYPEALGWGDQLLPPEASEMVRTGY